MLETLLRGANERCDIYLAVGSQNISMEKVLQMHFIQVIFIGMGKLCRLLNDTPSDTRIKRKFV